MGVSPSCWLVTAVRPDAALAQSTAAECNTFIQLRDDAQKKAVAVRAAVERKAERKDICALVQSYYAAESTVVKFLEDNKSWCGIPEEAIKAAKGNHEHTEKLRTAACAEGPAANPKAPSLSDAIGTPLDAALGNPTGIAPALAADPFGAIGPAHAAVPVGDWLTGDRKGKVRIVNCGGALCGTLTWLAEPNDPQTNKPKTDINNKDTSKQGRPLLGMPILLNVHPSAPDEWKGPIYNAEDGNTYNGLFTMYGPNTAQLVGCLMSGPRRFCKTVAWTRAPAAVFNEHPSLNAAAPLRAGIPLKKTGGTFVVPVQINGAITLDFTVDSGASDVTVPADVFSTLVRTGTIKNSDLIGEGTYRLADGSKTQSIIFVIRSLKVGDRVIENVRGSVGPSEGSLLLGQSFLERFKAWSIDNGRHVLLLEPK